MNKNTNKKITINEIEAYTGILVELNEVTVMSHVTRTLKNLQEKLIDSDYQVFKEFEIFCGGVEINSVNNIEPVYMRIVICLTNNFCVKQVVDLKYDIELYTPLECDVEKQSAVIDIAQLDKLIYDEINADDIVSACFDIVSYDDSEG